MSDGWVPTDPKLPELQTLLGQSAAGPLETVLESGGDGLAGFSISQISYRPDRRAIVVYDTVSTTGTRLPVVLATGEIPEGAAILASGGDHIGAWTAWNDPSLPGLSTVLDAGARQTLLEPLGIGGAPTRVRMRSYRPGKRAVVEVTGEGVRLFVKTIRPKDIAALQEAHVALSAELPIPRSLGWSPDAGIVALEPLAGTPLSSAIDQAPDPRVVFELLDRLPRLERSVSSRRRRLSGHLRLLRRVAPQQENGLSRIEEAAEALEDPDPIPVHGDFHSGQILVSSGALTGLVDIDTVGVGNRTDDYANLLAHLHVVALRDTTGAAAQYGERVYATAAAASTGDDLRIRTAATMLGYASGPWSRQEPDWPKRVERLVKAAAEWLEPGPVG